MSSKRSKPKWIHSVLSSSAVPYLFCLQSFPASRSFPMSWLFELDDQSTGASASVLPMNIQGWFPLGLTDLIPLQSKGLSRVFSSTTVQKHLFFGAQPSFIGRWGTMKDRETWHDPIHGVAKSHIQLSDLITTAFFMVQLSHPYMTTGKTVTLTIWTFVSKVTSLLSNMLSRFVIAFLPRSKCLLILWLQSPSAVILEPKKIIYVIASTFSLSICLEVMGPHIDALNMPANLENSAVTTELEKVSFHSIPKERQCQRMLKLPHNCSHLTC